MNNGIARNIIINPVKDQGRSETIVFYRPKSKTLLYIAGSIVFSGFCGYNAVVPSRYAEWGSLHHFILMIGFPFFALTGILNIVQLFRSPEILRLTPNGFLYRMGSDTVVPWRAITQISILKVRSIKFLKIELSPGTRRYSQPPRFKWKFAEKQRNQMTISLAGLNQPIDAVADEFVRRYRTALGAPT